MDKFQLLNVCLMVICGAGTTISVTFAMAKPARNSVGLDAYFEHYYFQTLLMMTGEMLCLGAYLFMKYVIHREDPGSYDNASKPVSSLVMLPASLLDIASFSCSFTGLGFLKDACLYQMLRVSQIVFCGLLSIPVLKRRLAWFKWTGILLVCIGLVVKSIIPKDSLVECNDDFATLNKTVEINRDNEEECNKTCQQIIGIVFVLVGQFFSGFMYVYREKCLNKHNIHPLKASGLEGLFGFLILCVILWPMNFIRIPKEGILKGLSLGPNGRMEDANDAIAMIFEGGQYWLLGWCLAFIFSVAFMNYAGFAVIKSLSATTAAVLRQVSIILVWAVFLIPWGPGLCRVQDHFSWTAVMICI